MTVRGDSEMASTPYQRPLPVLASCLYHRHFNSLVSQAYSNLSPSCPELRRVGAICCYWSEPCDRKRDDGLSECAGVFLVLPEIVRLLASSAAFTATRMILLLCSSVSAAFQYRSHMLTYLKHSIVYEQSSLPLTVPHWQLIDYFGCLNTACIQLRTWRSLLIQ